MVASVKVGVHDNRADIAGVWTALGALSTISHGGFLIFTLPIWLGFGITNSVQESKRGVSECPPQPLAVLKAYSRFPQSLPPRVDEDQLLGKPPRAQSVVAPIAPDPAIGKPNP